MMNIFDNEVGVEIKTIGDSRGYLWKIIIDKERGIGKIEKISGLNDTATDKKNAVDGSVYPLAENSHISDDMQNMTAKIESRFQAVGC